MRSAPSPRTGPSIAWWAWSPEAAGCVRRLFVLATEIESAREVPGIAPHARKRLEPKAPRHELQDRGRVVRRVVDVAALRERRHDDGRDARARAPAVAPARSRGWGHVIPVAAVLVVG